MHDHEGLIVQWAILFSRLKVRGSLIKVLTWQNEARAANHCCLHTLADAGTETKRGAIHPAFAEQD